MCLDNFDFALPEPNQFEVITRELLSGLEEGTVVTTEALRNMPQRNRLHDFFLERTTKGKIVLVDVAGLYHQTYASDALFLHVVKGYPTTVENGVLTVTIHPPDLDRYLQAMTHEH